MVVLRSIALLALIATLLQPVLSFTDRYTRPPRVTLLLDRSASMETVEDGLTRRARVDSLLSSPVMSDIEDRAKLRVFYFGGGLSDQADEIDPEKTALGDALARLQTVELAEPPDCRLVFTDGNSNFGQRPQAALASSEIPLTTIDMAAAAQDFDISLDEVSFNPVLFADKPTELKTRLKWHGAHNQTAAVELVDNGKALTTKRIPLSVEDGFGEVRLDYTPSDPGQKMLQVRIVPVDGERTSDNNNRTYAVKVLKSRMSVLLIAESPDYEVGFLKRFLDRSEKYEVDFRVTGSPAGNLAGSFPTRITELNRYDLVILYDPNPSRLTPHAGIIKSYLSDRGGAVWLIMGPHFANGRVQPWMEDLLPFFSTAVRTPITRSFNAQPTEDNLFHPVVRLADEQAAVRQAWADLQPFDRLVFCDTVQSQAVLLATTVNPMIGRGEVPVLGFRRIGAGKLLAAAATPFWPWGFSARIVDPNESPYTKFLSGTVEWLTVSDDFAPLQIKPSSDVFTRGEPVQFTGYAYDLGYRPLPGVSGTVDLINTDNGEKFQTDLIGEGEGILSGRFANLPPGDYRFNGELTTDSAQLKQVSGQIRVESFSLEEFDRSGRPGLLAELARMTGGRYLKADQFNELTSTLDLRPIAVDEHRELSFWGKFWMLMIAVGALSLEWLIRKANQLI